MAPLVQVRNLKKYFGKDKTLVKAIDGISFDIQKGETLGLVGESGCGKSTTGRSLLRLESPTEGEILFEGESVLEYNKKALQDFRKRAQIIFQDPYASLNPRMSAFDIIAEPLYIHFGSDTRAHTRRVHELLELVGLNPQAALRYPHEFSGGQRQRIGIARALALQPEFIVCDEPISALDVSIQAQIVNLLKNLQKQFQLTYLFIAHDLSMVKYISDRVAVMYLGHMVELAPSDELYQAPQHPYTQALLSAIPIADPLIERKRSRVILQGDIADAPKPQGGCPFADRCPLAIPRCKAERPAWKEVRPNHFAACHLMG